MIRRNKNNKKNKTKKGSNSSESKSDESVVSISREELEQLRAAAANKGNNNNNDTSSESESSDDEQNNRRNSRRGHKKSSRNGGNNGHQQQHPNQVMHPQYMHQWGGGAYGQPQQEMNAANHPFPYSPPQGMGPYGPQMQPYGHQMAPPSGYGYPAQMPHPQADLSINSFPPELLNKLQAFFTNGLGGATAVDAVGDCKVAEKNFYGFVLPRNVDKNMVRRYPIFSPEQIEKYGAPNIEQHVTVFDTLHADDDMEHAIRKLNGNIPDGESYLYYYTNFNDLDHSDPEECQPLFAGPSPVYGTLPYNHEGQRFLGSESRVQLITFDSGVIDPEELGEKLLNGGGIDIEFSETDFQKMEASLEDPDCNIVPCFVEVVGTHSTLPDGIKLAGGLYSDCKGAEPRRWDEPTNCKNGHSAFSFEVYPSAMPVERCEQIFMMNSRILRACAQLWFRFPFDRIKGDLVKQTVFKESDGDWYQFALPPQNQLDFRQEPFNCMLIRYLAFFCGSEIARVDEQHKCCRIYKPYLDGLLDEYKEVYTYTNHTLPENSLRLNLSLHDGERSVEDFRSYYQSLKDNCELAGLGPIKVEVTLKVGYIASKFVTDQ